MAILYPTKQMSWVPFQWERNLDSSISYKTKFSWKKKIAYYRSAMRTRNNWHELLYVTSGVQLHTGYLQDGHLKMISNSSVHWQVKQYTFIVTKLLNILKLKYIILPVSVVPLALWKGQVKSNQNLSDPNFIKMS